MTKVLLFCIMSHNSYTMHHCFALQPAHVIAGRSDIEYPGQICLLPWSCGSGEICVMGICMPSTKIFPEAEQQCGSRVCRPGTMCMRFRWGPLCLAEEDLKHVRLSGQKCGDTVCPDGMECLWGQMCMPS